MPLLPLILSLLILTAPSSLMAVETANRTLAAKVLERSVYEDDLVPPRADAEQKSKLSNQDHTAWYERTRDEALRNLVWSAVFGNFAQKRMIEPTPVEIDSEIRSQKKFRAEDKVRRERQREELIAGLASPGSPRRSACGRSSVWTP